MWVLPTGSPPIMPWDHLDWTPTLPAAAPPPPPSCRPRGSRPPSPSCRSRGSRPSPPPRPWRPPSACGSWPTPSGGDSSPRARRGPSLTRLWSPPHYSSVALSTSLFPLVSDSTRATNDKLRQDRRRSPVEGIGGSCPVMCGPCA